MSVMEFLADVLAERKPYRKQPGEGHKRAAVRVAKQRTRWHETPEKSEAGTRAFRRRIARDWIKSDTAPVGTIREAWALMQSA